MKQFIEVRGARHHNLQNIDVNIPRDKLTVITGVSGSGKSSLAFDVIYGEGQRKLLESLTAFAKGRVQQPRKPDVDFVFGLSPVIAIEQKKGSANPRSTVGTMTDINDYVRLLYAACGDAHCPYCGTPIPAHSTAQIADRIRELPAGTRIILSVTLMTTNGEEIAILLDDLRHKGMRSVRINGHVHALDDKPVFDEDTEYKVEAVSEPISIQPALAAETSAVLERILAIGGDGYVQIERSGETGTGGDLHSFFEGFGCPAHRLVMGELQPSHFSFNNPDSACITCGGIGMFMRADPKLLVRNPDKSMNKGAFDPQLFNPSGTTTWRWLMFYNLARHYGFSLDTPFKDLPEHAADMLLHGTRGERIPLLLPEDAQPALDKYAGQSAGFIGYVSQVNRAYKQYLKRTAKTWEDEFYGRIMVETVCPDCAGKKLRPQRLCVTVGGRDIYEFGDTPIKELESYLQGLHFSPPKEQAGRQIAEEIRKRLSLLIDVGLGYLNLGRRSDTISGGEAQRLRLSTQISSGLMGMLYVLDEPSIGLHARDTARIIHTLKNLRDIGNTIIVVEHDPETIRSADHIIEIGPGAGTRGGTIVSEGSADELCRNAASVTGAFLSGAITIPIPEQRRKPSGQVLSVIGARANNLRNIDLDIPLQVFVCVTGVSGSGKSTLINDIVHKQLHAMLHNPRIVPGEHDAILGYEHLNAVIHIDQSPIGRSTRSNPATYVGIFDRIRECYADTEAAANAGLTKNDFSFNNKNGGRCEACDGEGIVTTELQFMPDVETTCPACKGARFSKRVLDIKFNGKNIAHVLDLSIEEAVAFFAEHPYILHKLTVMNRLGLGYLRLGQSSTTLSGGEAQRVKLASELGKIKRGAHNLYLLDEPTTGLHLQDIQNLINCLDQLVDAGHSVLVIEHHLELIKVADYIIDMGPEGGNGGGMVVAQGTPEEICAMPGSHTGRFLSEILSVSTVQA